MFGLRSARGRVALATGVLILVLVAVAIAAVLRVRQHQEQLLALEATSASVAALENAHAQLYHQMAAVSPLVFSDDPGLVDDYHEAVAEMEQDLSQARAVAVAAGKDDHVATLDDLTERIGNFDRTVNMALPLLLQSDPESRVQMGSAAVSGMWTEVGAIVAALDQLAQDEQAELVAARAAANDAAAVTSWIIVGVGCVALLVATGMVMATIASVVGPLVSLRASARAITSGNLEARAEVSGPEEVASVARDFNEMADALAAKTEEYIDTVNLTGDIIIRLDKDGRFTFLNDSACQSLGKPREELLGTEAGAFLHPEDFEAACRAVEKVMESRGLVKGFESRIVTPTGTRVVEWNGHLLFDEEGQYAGIQITGRDTSERRQMEEALLESEEQYRAIFEQAAESIVLIDAETGALVQFNDRAHQALGYTREEFERLKVSDFEVVESPEEVAAHIEKIITEGTDTFETKHRTKGAEIRDIQVSSKAISIGGRQFAQTVWHDITERKRAEEELASSEERLKILFEFAPDAYYLNDLEGNFVDGNKAAEELIGYKKKELIGKSFLDLNLLPPEQLEKAAAILAKNVQGLPTGPDELTLIRKGGNEVPVEIRTFPVRIGEQTLVLGLARDITERKKAQEALRESEERFRSLSTSAPIGIFLTDVQGKCTYANPRLQEIAGLALEESLGFDWGKVIHPDDREPILKEAEKAAGQGGELSHDMRILTPEGELRWIHVHTTPTFSTEGKVIGRVGAVEDITERKKAEEALRESEERYRLITENVSDVIWTADLDRRYTYVSPSVTAMRGYTPEELIGTKQSDIMSDVYNDLFEKILAKDLAELSKRANRPLRPRTFEVELDCKDGSTIRAEVKAVLIRDSNGRPIGIQGVTRDITERKQMEQALAAKTKEYIDTVNLTGDIIARLDKDGRFTFVNDAACQTFGKPREELLGTEAGAFMHPEDREAASRAVEGAMESKGPMGGFESRVVTPKGERVVEWTGHFFFDEGGQFAGIQVTGRDITERKKMEEALRESEGRYRLLAENTSDLIWTMDLGLRYTYMSPAITHMRGYTVEEIMAQTVNESMTPASREVAVKTLAEELAMERMENKDITRTRKLELEMYCKDGSTIWTEMHMKFLRDPDGNPIGILGTTRDISERKQMEEALRESEARYRLIAENASDLIWTMDLNLRYTYMSPAVERMRGYTAEEVIGTRVSETMTPASLDAVSKAFAQEMALEKEEQKDLFRSRTLEAEMYCKDGSTVWTEIKMTFLRDPHGRPIGILGVTRDISERKKAELEREGLHAELELRAITDSLTGLYDHAHFYQRLAEEIDRAKRYKHGFAVVMLDVDDFKRFNDCRGHQAGDKALRLISYCIRSGLRRSDIAFRYGGDEFAAILPHANPPRAAAVVNRINRHITRRLKEIDGGSLTRLNLSAGVACFPDDGITADELVRMADAALYSAKWIARARDIMGQREDIQSLVSALVSRRAGAEDPAARSIFRPEALHEQQARIVSSVASSIAVALKDAGVAQALEDPDLQVLATVGAAAEIKDRYIRGHPERTSEQAAALATKMGLSPERVRDIKVAGLLHDIGKVTVREGILNKPGKLTRREFNSVKDHPIVGATLISQVKGFERLVPIVRHHHERFEGKGYPDGLAGEEIPLEARILSVVDVFDALTHQRSYRKALNREDSIAELERGAGTQFDPVVVEAFLDLLKTRGEGLAVPVEAESEDRQSGTA